MLPTDPALAPHPGPPRHTVAATTTAVVTITTADGVVTPAYLTIPVTTAQTAPEHVIRVPYEAAVHTISTTRTAVPQWAIGLAVGGIGIGVAVAGIGYGIGAAAPGLAAGADFLWALTGALVAATVLVLLVLTRIRPARR